MFGFKYKMSVINEEKGIIKLRPTVGALVKVTLLSVAPFALLLAAAQMIPDSPETPDVDDSTDPFNMNEGKL